MHGEPADEISRTAMAAEPFALAERVADHLRDLVVRGALKPGERIVERRLGAELGVSRTPMREALKLLRADGLVEISRNRGARVSAYTAVDATRLFEVIAALEGMAAERFAAALDDASLMGLEALHAEMRAQHDAGQLDAYFATNTAIHDAIVHGSGNPLLVEARDRLMLHAKRGRYMAIMDAARWREAVGEHDALMSSLRNGDAPAAGAIWRAHLESTGRHLARTLA